MHLISLAKLLLVIIIISHLFCSFWLFIGISVTDEKTWISSFNIEGKDWYI